MAIDADLNTGAIDEATARKRRLNIQREADFYGAMDGASKFIKGDAIVGIVITIINIIGGLIIGVAMNGMEFSQAISIYTLATVGDGLVSQIPALLISTSTGIVVTRAASENSFGENVAQQLLGKPYVMIGAGAIIALMSLIPGLPKPPMLVLAVILAVVGYNTISKEKKAVSQDKSMETAAEEKRKPENIVNLLTVEPIELEFGYGIIPMVDTNMGETCLNGLS